MLSNILDRLSFLSLFLLIVLLPVFFLPFTKIPIETSKGLLLVAGLATSVVFWSMARFFDGKIRLPKSFLLLSGLGVVLAFLLSAFFSGAPQVSFFGTMFDLGTFWFIFAGFLLMFLTSIIFRDSRSAKKVLFGIIIFSAIALIFQSFRFFMPNFLSLGMLGDKTDNILGSWNAFGLFAGFTALLSLFLIEFFPIGRFMKWVLGVLLLFALVLVAAVNLSFVWILLGIFALIIFVYKVSFFYARNQAEGEKFKFPALSFGIIMVALLFFMSNVFIGGLLPGRLGLLNTEVRPSFADTSLVTKSALAQNPILGIGPNRFSEVWAKYKPADINRTQSWDTYFDYGSGLLPTFASTTGYLGILAWLIFFALFIRAGVKSLFSNPGNVVHPEMTAFFVISLYLFVSSFFYSTGPVIFLLALAFTGIFVGVSQSRQSHGEVSISLLNDPRKSFSFILFLVFMIVFSAATSFKYIERLASVSYFGQALSAPNIETAESSISKALSLYSNDLYLRTYAQIYLVKFNSLVTKDSPPSESKKSELQMNFDQAVNGATLATQYNSGSYLNFQMLGLVYQTVGSFGVSGAYDKAIEAYKRALTLNPLNPGTKLAIARVYFANGKVKEAKDYTNEALTLKGDYIDALITFSQILKSEGNTSGALAYAETALSISPQNKDLIQYVNSLKNGGFSSAPDNSNNLKEKKR